MQLVERNRVQLIWVSGHEGIDENKMADQLAKLGSEHPFTGPEPGCGIPMAPSYQESGQRLGFLKWAQTGGLCQ
jgi:ribonuclease HI